MIDSAMFASRRTRWLIGAIAVVGAGLAVPANVPANAQTGGPNLQEALQRIASNAEDSSALADAGLAALALGDTRAAIGFLAKADEIYPRSGRVKEGLARALLAEQNPVGALRYFDEALANGVPVGGIAADRGLAYDLIGRTADAQRDYRLALQAGADDIVALRYAISLGIGGDVAGAEERLAPFLQRSDRTAWRNRAFILAMNGKNREANRIAAQTMQRPMARAIRPFFDRMDKLTAAQKAAAVHLGHFPASENIGVDAASLQYAGNRAVRGGTGADAGLIPLGDPLGDSIDEDVRKPRVLAMPNTAPRRRPGRKISKRTERELARAERREGRRPVGERSSRRQRAIAILPDTTLPAPTAADSSAPTPAPDVEPEAQVATIAERSVAPVPVAAPPASAPLPPRDTQPTVVERVEIAESSVPRPGFQTPLADTPATVGGQDVNPPTSVLPATRSATPPEASTLASPSAPTGLAGLSRDVPLVSRSIERTVPIGNSPAPGRTSPTPTPNAQPANRAPVPLAGFDLAQTGAGSSPDAEPSATNIDIIPKRALSDIIGAIAIPDTEKEDGVVPVDLSSIEPARAKPPEPVAAATKTEPKPEPAEKPADYPSRNWVQIATGADLEALKYDLRRMKRAQADLFEPVAGWTSPWGQTRRLVVGPFDTLSAARTFEAAFRKGGGDGFVWQSAQGTEVTKLNP